MNTETLPVIAGKELPLSALKSFPPAPGGTDAHPDLSEQQLTIHGEISHLLQVVSHRN